MSSPLWGLDGGGAGGYVEGMGGGEQVGTWIGMSVEKKEFVFFF